MKEIFVDFYKKVVDFFKQEEEKDTTKNVARNRLKLVLMQDRTNINPRLLERMRGELIELLSKYVEMDKEQLELNLTPEDNQFALMLSIPVIRAKNEEEIEAILKAEDEARLKLTEIATEEDEFDSEDDEAEKLNSNEDNDATTNVEDEEIDDATEISDKVIDDEIALDNIEQEKTPENLEENPKKKKNKKNKKKQIIENEPKEIQTEETLKQEELQDTTEILELPKEKVIDEKKTEEIFNETEIQKETTSET